MENTLKVKLRVFEPAEAPEFNLIIDESGQHEDKIIYAGKNIDRSQHIVKCVNMHDEMLSALETALDTLKKHNRLNTADNSILIVSRAIEKAK